MKTDLPLQPTWFLSYFRVGRLLYSSLILFILESYIYWVQIVKAQEEESLFGIVFWIYSFLFSFVHIFLVMMDGWSRFQDYKRAKDLFYAHGFQPRIARSFMRSKCQRMAAIVAAEELGIEKEINQYYYGEGVRWYHYIPYFMVRDPLFIFRKYFWSRTFLEKHYIPKYDYHQLQQASLI